MADRHTRRCLCVILLLFTMPKTSAEHCTKLVFPTLDYTLTLSAEINTKIVLPFRLDSACTLPKDFGIEVSKPAFGAAAVPKIMCNIQHVNGVCYASESASCSCLANDEYELHKTAQLSDKGEWVWKTDGVDRQVTKIMFNITESTLLPNANQSTTSSSTIVLAALAAVAIVVLALTFIVRRMLRTRGTAGQEQQAQQAPDDVSKRRGNGENQEYHVYFDVRDESFDEEESQEAPGGPASNMSPEGYLLPIQTPADLPQHARGPERVAE